MKTEYLLHQLENAIALRNHEHQTWLNIFFASFSTTSLLFVALFSGNKRDFWEVLVISVFGILITLRFKGIQERAFLTMKAYEEFSKLIESKIKTVEGDFCSYNIFRGNYGVDSSNSNLSDYCVEKPDRERNAGKARNSINQFYLLTIALWTILLIIFSYLEIVPYLTKCNCN